MSRLFFFAVALICCYGLSGCDFPEQRRPVAGIGGVDIDPGTTLSGGPSATESTPAQTQVANPPAPTPPSEYRTTAEAGDSGFKKGQYGRTSIFSTNVASFYRMQERINLQMIEYNMKLYKAEHGNAPKTHEEFMSKIIGQIKLPELKEGCRYDYNPQTEELEIVHPL